MKILTAISIIFFCGTLHAQGITPESALNQMTAFGQKIDISEIRRAASTQNGRIKPFATLSRETMLFLTGSYRKWGMNSEQMYLTISSFENSAYAPIIEIRDIELRKRLGYPSEKKYFSLADLENSPLEKIAGPLLQKDQDGKKLVENEKKVVEAYSQMNLFRQIATRQHFLSALDFSWLNGGQLSPSSPVAATASQYLDLLKNENFTEAYEASKALKELTRKQEAPELFKHSLEKLDLEVFYFDIRLFLWAAIFSFIAGTVMLIDVTRKKLSPNIIKSLFGLVMLPIVIGLSLRVYITQFAPITNMYGTMIWVSFGITLFGFILYSLYRQVTLCGFMFLGTGAMLFLTENIPLVLSPDMDPIVAVLRSNFWLSTHVTTITISYAAFSIAMILGNMTLIKSLFKTPTKEELQNTFQAAYRMVQLGCFLLTVGIILGGIWADYSWGRFWGWDPKETWALIADMGFLVLLHARYIGWLNPFTFLAFLPASYLLVVMAWYGVNFILAAGLHSYGFSSGGAMAVGIFVSIQVTLIAIAWLKLRLRPQKNE